MVTMAALNPHPRLIQLTIALLLLPDLAAALVHPFPSPRNFPSTSHRARLLWAPVPARASATSEVGAASSSAGESCTGERVVVAGATGYIGRAVVKECIRRGYPTTALVRDRKRAAEEDKLSGASLVETDPCQFDVLAACPAFEKGTVDVVISCLASRSGIKKDAYLVDYQATLNCMEAARAAGARHFVLLSAFCVAKPWLQFQFAKLKFEEALQQQTDLSYSIVRPTAFFKSVSGQLEVVQSGAPFIYFDLGEGRSATCNPISEADLAVALVDTIADPAMKNKIWNIGGPDAGVSMVEQGQMLAEVTGREPWIVGVPIGIFDAIINGLQWVADTFQSEQFENAAELARIGKYYAVEDMLTTEPSERFGSTTLREHYARIATEGQEYDPYTTMFAGKKT